MSKIFSSLLDIRLRTWSESNNLLCQYQFGFRTGKCTTDCIFVLKSIIDKVINNEKRKLYCAFVDFRKAFDLVYRNGILLKSLRSGSSTKFVNMLQRIYASVKTCNRVNGTLTDYSNSYKGVKQGEPLSPILFLFFINDMYNALYDDHVDVFSIHDIQLFMLLFADDTVLFSYTIEGLQALLDKLKTYCDKWGIEVNIDKTVAMVFKKRQ